MKSKFKYYEIVKVLPIKPSLKNIWGEEAWISGKGRNEEGEWSYGISLLNDTWEVEEDDLISIHPINLRDPNQVDIAQIIRNEGKYQIEEHVKVISNKPHLERIFGQESYISQKMQEQDGGWKYQICLFSVCWDVEEYDIVSTGRFEPKENHLPAGRMRVSQSGELLEYEEFSEGYDPKRDEERQYIPVDGWDEEYLDD